MDELKDLMVACEGIKTPIGKMSDDIKQIEASLTGLNFNFSFFCESDLRTGTLWYIEWKMYRELCPKFRLYLSSLETDTKKKSFCKAMIECKLEVRLNFYRYLPSFMVAFTKACHEEKKRIEELVTAHHTFQPNE